ncbi:anaerobic ribonucleoside-triphosphate reductase activating protein [Candidatus Ruminimicrobiellum ovillum]|uniref:anaerobic ribonucleoside-triphosphate reductase activating protein n=1 Tax=Candidatus Ruminimicrobiellum ovillum TaxID=1947927 RepID=UPI00355AC49E
MRIGGLQKFSFIDFPNKTAAIIFTQGCNFRCAYCHNPELIYPNMYQVPMPEEQIFAFLESRRNQLDAVVITGGEPTLQPDLIDFIKKVKAMGFLVKLDSNGSNPEVLEQIINQKLVDFIAMDIKAPFDKYNLVCCVPVNIENIKRSIELIKNSGIDFLFRTTYDKSKLFDEDIQTMTNFLNVDTHYKVQKCNPVILH